LGVKWGKTVSDLEAVKSAAQEGFDSAELTVGLIAALDEVQFQHQRENLLQSGLTFEVFAAPLPAGVRVTEQGFNIYVWSEYLKRALDRVSTLGCRKVVWSDGKSRILPLEGEVEAAKRQALQFLFMLSEIAETNAIEVLIEPLDPRRTNFLTSMDEVKEFLDLVGRQNLSSLISLRDLEAIGFDEIAFGRHAQMISHVHMENPSAPAGGRLEPRADDGYDYRSFLAQLSKIVYSETITLPAGADADSLRFCRGLLAG